MQLQQNISLKPYNSFAIEARARYFASFTDTESLRELLSQAPKAKANAAVSRSKKTPAPTLILGGGSNILFTSDFKGLVLKNEIRGIELVKEDKLHVYIKTGAGENWHQFVLHCIKRNWAGIENLSLIPGNVGASPMQNIGAYGVEIKEVFEELEAFHFSDKKVYTLTANDCQFGYRDSIFKNKYKGEMVILSVTFRLNKLPKFNISYGQIKEELEKMKVSTLSIAAISQAVINIRSSRLPDPAKIGNAGSFFKNPVVTAGAFQRLKKIHPGIVGFENANATVKLAAGWLIEQCGWKGYRKGDAGCHAEQALVLVNYGSATGVEIDELSEAIRKSVNERFGLLLEKEVNII